MDVMAARIYIKSKREVKALPATNFLYDCMPNLTHCGFRGDATQAYDFLSTTGAPDDSCSPIDPSLGGNAQHCTEGPETPTPCPGICTPATMCRNRTDGDHGARYRGLLFFVESWQYLGKGTTVEQIMEELSTHGPIAAGMCANKEWVTLNTTRRGQVLPASAGTTCDHINHDVNYVGWGTATAAEGGLDYWLIRNSFGANWGEQGYFRIERGKNAFMIEEHMRAPVPRWELAPSTGWREER